MQIDDRNNPATLNLLNSPLSIKNFESVRTVPGWRVMPAKIIHGIIA